MAADEPPDTNPDPETKPDPNSFSTNPYPQDRIAEVLLEHARWVGSDLAQRIDTMTQRAGVLLAASLTLATLWTAILIVVAEHHPAALVIGTLAALAAHAIPAAYSLTALRPRTYHSFGTTNITRYLRDDRRPEAQNRPDIHNLLLNDLTAPSDKGSDAALQGLEKDIKQKAGNIQAAQVTLVVVTAVAPLALLAAYFCWRLQ